MTISMTTTNSVTNFREYQRAKVCLPQYAYIAFVCLYTRAYVALVLVSHAVTLPIYFLINISESIPVSIPKPQCLPAHSPHRTPHPYPQTTCKHSLEWPATKQTEAENVYVCNLLLHFTQHHGPSLPPLQGSAACSSAHGGAWNQQTSNPTPFPPEAIYRRATAS